MISPETSHRPADADRVAAISRLVRRVCLLREQGEHAGAADVESTRLAEAVRAHREAGGPGTFTDAALAQLFETERARIADAAALCELLAPRLAELLPAATRTPAPRRHSPRPTPQRDSAAPADPPEIHEMLDAMLAAESTGRRTARHNRPET